MNGQELEQADHVSRYCKPKDVQNGRILAGAFKLRPREQYLSVSWLEYFKQANDISDAINFVRATFKNKNYQVRPNGRFAVLRVGTATAAIRDAHSRSLIFQHRPTKTDPSHAGILGYEPQDLSIATELTALITANDIHPAILSLK